MAGGIDTQNFSLVSGTDCDFAQEINVRAIPKKSKKTIIGYFAGFLASLIVSMTALWIFETNLALIKLIVIALGGAIMFLVIDLLNLKIDDNILNPIFCALVMGILYVYL